MKRNLLIIALISCFGILIFSSYEHGPAYEGGINRTGSQGGAANCAGSGCHAANALTTVVEVKVYNTTGAAVSQYTPGGHYIVAITGNNTASGISVDKFGFQVSAVLGSSSQAGTFSVASGTDLRVTTLGGLQIVEHKDELDDTFTNHFVARFYWTAPATGSGDVNFYGILNAMGGDGDRGLPGNVKFKPTDDDDDDDDDDDADTTLPNTSPVLTLTEGAGGGPNAVGEIFSSSIQVYPNPCANMINVNAEELSGTYQVCIYAMNGAKVYTNNAAAGVTPINMAELASGIYQVEVKQGAARMIKPVVKQ